MAKKTASKTLRAVFFSVLRLAVNLIILYLLLQLFLFAYHFAYQVFANEAYQPKNKATVTVTVHEGASAMNIARVLEEEGVIVNKYTFILRYRFSKYNGQLKAGTYEVGPSMKTDDILAILSAEEPESNKGET